MTTPEPQPQVMLPGAEGTLVEHLKELRRRLMWGCLAIGVGFLGCYLVKERLFNLLMYPLMQAHPDTQMIFTAVHELFFTYLKLSFLGGLFLGFPILLLQIWKFIAPGLYDQERQMLGPFLVATPMLFYLGGLFTYFVVMPIAISFFFSFETLQIHALPSAREYLSFLVKMTFGFGLAFELPIFLLLMMKAGILTPQKLSAFRRYAWIAILAASAVLTPPDPLSQVLLALPMVLLYEVALWIGYARFRHS